MRIWFITDTHLGIRNSSNTWIEIMEDYFHNFFIPLVEKHWKPGDVLFHLGDVYDSRQSINLRVLNSGVNIFEKLSKIFGDGVHIIAGNHDCYGRNSNDINSLTSLKWIPGIKIYTEPQKIKIGPAEILLMPWRKDHIAEKECVKEFGGADYLFCHADIQGLKFNKFVEIENGVDLMEFKNFKKVYSGHIHYAQRVSNVVMLGSPYSLTRSDIGNEKGIVLLDLNTGEETFFANDYSPKFLKIKFDAILNMTVPELKDLVRNNFIDVLISSNHIVKAPINSFLEMVDGYRNIDFYPYNNRNEEDLLEGKDSSSYGENFDLIKFVREYIDSLPYEQDTRDKLYKSVVHLKKVTEDKNNNVEINEDLQNKI
jgi:DNA repair exonuclease SbcCD nuclease subunit